MRKSGDSRSTHSRRLIEPSYGELIEWLESHPDNRPGTDKSWVEKATREYREHYRRARRVR